MSLKQQSTSGEDIPELKSSGDVDADIKAKEELTPTEKQVLAARKSRVKNAIKSTLSDLVLKPSAEEESTSTAGKTTDSLVGQVLFGKYGISGVVEKTDCTITYKARNLENRDKVYLKTPLYVTDEICAAFKSYAEKNLALKQDHITEYLEYLEAKDGRPYLIFRRVMAVALDDLLDEVVCISTPNEFADIVDQICIALEHAHSEDILHGNLRPSCIHLVESEGKVSILLSDFGLLELKKAVYEHIGNAALPNTELQFYSPEHARKEELVQASDLYQLGLIAYFLLTGKAPYEGESENELLDSHTRDNIRPKSLVKIRKDFHNVEDLEKLLFETLDSDRDWRIQKVSEFRNEIKAWLAAEPKSAPISSSREELTVDDVESMKASKGDLKTTVHNLVALRRHQVEQEETVMMKFSDALAKSGPRQSPRKAAMKLMITYVGGTMLLVLIATYSILNWETIQEAYRTHSINLSSILKGGSQEASAQNGDEELPPMEGDPLEDQTANNASAQTTGKSGTNTQAPSQARPSNASAGFRRRRVFKYEESPAYIPFIPKEKGSKPVIIE
ncbi:MAG: protein kinase [Candidatus Obscuribacterales bacterium]|nr:protein kinase [Cyanobacteria bacterium HKST-UBA01]MCB9466684.1 protein kinase [Candidatus Obscuribacterales bacterium]